MRLLLDTHAALWFLLDDPQLSAKARACICEGETVCLSPASLWEIAIKISLGKYELPTPFAGFWKEQLQINDFSLLNLSVDHVARIAELPFHHRDPFDRCIIAQALAEDLAVISADVVFDRYGVSRIW